VTTRVGFLRAVNVGKRTVRMATLKRLCEGLGYTNVWTHISSGNVVFDAGGRRGELERQMEQVFEDEFGFETTTFVRTPAEITAALAVEPFPVASGDTYFLTFLKAPPSQAVAEELEAASNDFDTLVVVGRDVHWRMRGKSTDTKLKKSVWARLGPNSSTSRNVTMLRALVTRIGT
jgi:uncharacterized protein (DUF1697 family)